MAKKTSKKKRIKVEKVDKRNEQNLEKFGINKFETVKEKKEKKIEGAQSDLVEHKVKIKDRFKPFQQPPPAIFCHGTIKSQRRNLTSSQSQLYPSRPIR